MKDLYMTEDQKETDKFLEKMQGKPSLFETMQENLKEERALVRKKERKNRNHKTPMVTNRSRLDFMENDQNENPIPYSNVMKNIGIDEIMEFSD